MFTFTNHFTFNHLIQLMDSLNVGIVITDEEGIVLLGNAYYCNLAKFDIRTYYGRNIREISKNEIVELPDGKILLDIAIENNKEVSELVKYNTEDYVITTVTPVPCEKGEKTFYLYTVTNYSEAMRLRKELLLSHARTSALEEQLQELQFRKLIGKDIVVKDREMKRIFRLGARLASVPSSVMILGESGVGKDILAKFIHNSGERREEPFIHVNLGAIPKELFESQLFGYESGAFTGASKGGKIGLIELADKGTLFLDEIGELPLDIQAKLLQVVQDKKLRRVGATEMVPVDIRIISATNRNLIEMVQKNLFRLDLFYRLNVIEINIPALCQRKADIPFLVVTFLKKFNEKYHMAKEIPPEVMEILLNYPWPGNIRQLRHVIERLLVLGSNATISMDQLPAEFRSKDLEKKVRPLIDESSGLKGAISSIEKQLIQDALEKMPTAAAAAEYLKIDPSTLSKKRKQYGL